MLLSLIPEDILSSDAFSASVALARIHNLADGISVGEVNLDYRTDRTIS